jgi:hypothetical protein
MSLPPSNVTRAFGSVLYQTIDQRFHLPFDFLVHEERLPEHVQEAMGQNSDE